MGLLTRVLGGARPEDRARLAPAAAAVDRELAANIELASLWDQTHQAVTFENGEFARFRSTIEVAAPAAFAQLREVYERIPEAEAAMERRGPVNSIKPADKALVEAWEGDVRQAQRELRSAVNAPAPSVWALLTARLRGGTRSGR
ncbi:MAG TPA: hypothetical protein VM052_08435 [Candidatus Limnocylindrales bacterium]|nr:hypothetical protein [Candidatus Limnocylindrales bacterium]